MKYYKNILFNFIIITIVLISCNADEINSPSTEHLGSIDPEESTVIYDNRTYKTVKIGDQRWFKENLNVGTLFIRNSTSDDQTNNGSVEKFCYNNEENNCNTYGGLYQWDELMQYITTAGAQGLCPTGWHIPTREEFDILIDFVEKSSNSLKAIGQGTGNGAGTDTSNFSALFAGHRDHNDGESHALGADAIFWTSTQNGENAFTIDLYNYNNAVYSMQYHKKHGFSVRCLED